MRRIQLSEFSPEVEVDMVHQYEVEHRTMRQIADSYGVSYNCVREVLVRHGIHLRDRVERANIYNPSPKEIEERTAEIRKGWDYATERSRNQYYREPILTVDTIPIRSLIGRRLMGGI